MQASNTPPEATSEITEPTPGVDEPTDEVISVEALLTRARDQEGVDQLWSLTVASQALRERRAPPALLDWVDGQLRTYLGSRVGGLIVTQ